jgi:hypothetical protein
MTIHQFRPKQVTTVGEAIDWLNHLIINGVSPNTPLMANDADGLARGVTIVHYDADDWAKHESDNFVVIEIWTDEQLAANAANCDRLGIPND